MHVNRKWAVFIYQQLFCPNLRPNRLCETMDAKQYKFGSIMTNKERKGLTSGGRASLKKRLCLTSLLFNKVNVSQLNEQPKRLKKSLKRIRNNRRKNSQSRRLFLNFKCRWAFFTPRGFQVTPIFNPVLGVWISDRTLRSF